MQDLDILSEAKAELENSIAEAVNTFFKSTKKVPSVYVSTDGILSKQSPEPVAVVTDVSVSITI